MMLEPWFVLFLLPSPALALPYPPDQPIMDPGGSDYTHHGVKSVYYDLSEKSVWIFEPDNPL